MTGCGHGACRGMLFGTAAKYEEMRGRTNGAVFDMDGLLFDTEQFSWKNGEPTAGELGQVHNPDFFPALGSSSWGGNTAIIRRLDLSVEG